jgi:hypothetical protein
LLADLLRYTRNHAFPHASDNGHTCSADLPCLSARRAIRQLGSHDSNGERYRIRFGCARIVRGSGVFICALHLQIRAAWFCCKECIRFLRPEFFLFQAMQFYFTAF